jgi:MoxR-like ATPase
MFRGALTVGTSSDGFAFTPETGVLKRVGKVQEYIFAALLGILPKNNVISVNVSGQDRTISYGEILDAIQAAVHVIPQGQTVEPIPVFDLSKGSEIERLKAELEKVWGEAVSSPLQAVVDEDGEPLDYEHVDIPQNPDLLGIDPAVYRQINAMLKSGKQHLMLYGPPGTGKTSLARWIATNLPGGKWTLITGSSDWSSQDIIGGYQPIGGGEVDFVPGILLRAFDQPLIIDELNRCDIDKVIGPLFTVLSGQHTTLPYRTDIGDKDSQPYVILPKPKAGSAEYEFAPGPGWRLIATINSIDKASLYQMSYALSRRFGWVYVDTPRNLTEFVRDFLVYFDPQAVQPDTGLPCPLADLWKAINAVRVIGPAPIIDAIRAIKAMDPNVEFFGLPSAAMRITALDAIDMVLLPMLDGILYQDAMSIAEAAITAFAFNEVEQAQIKARLESVAIG